MRLRHGILLLGEIWFYAARNRAWWLLPTALVLALGAALATAGQAVVPYAVYTLF